MSEYETQIRMADDHHELQRLRKLRALIPELIEELEAIYAEQREDEVQLGYYDSLTAVVAKLREASQ